VINDPVNFIDPAGLAWSWEKTWRVKEQLDRRSQQILEAEANFLAGFADELTWGATDLLRDLTGTAPFVDECSGWYEAGEWAGLAWDLAMAALTLRPKPRGPLSRGVIPSEAPSPLDAKTVPSRLTAERYRGIHEPMTDFTTPSLPQSAGDPWRFGID
jgi:hypothetical protein